MSKLQKVFACDIKQVGPETDRVLRFIGSDETPDRDNDIIEVAGWQLDNYQRNPVFLWAHNYDEPPIGKAVNVTKDLVGGKLTFDIQFPDPDVYPFADTIYQLYKGGFLSATSVGFRGTKFKTRDDEAVSNQPEWMRGRRYTEQELLELSAVPVPSNPNALQAVRGKGFKDEDIAQVFVEPDKLKGVFPKAKMADCPHICCVMCDKQPCEQRMECCQGCMMCCQEMCEECDQTCKMQCCAMCQAQCQTLCGACPKTDCSMSTDTGSMDGASPKTVKSGATVSVKNRELLAAIHAHFEGGTKQLKDFLESVMPMDSAQMTAQMTTPGMGAAMTIGMSDELKQAFADLTAKVTSLAERATPPSTPKAKSEEIDLDAIESPKATPNAADIELNIEPGELKRLIAETTQEIIRGGIHQ